MVKECPLQRGCVPFLEGPLSEVPLYSPIEFLPFLLCAAVFYWMLLNIHPAYRSTLHSIQLLAVVKSSLLKEYGIDAVMKPAILDLKKLTNDVC